MNISYARSHTEPRTLAGYRALTKSTDIAGFVKMKVISQSSARAFRNMEWEEKYVMLKNGGLHYFSINEVELEAGLTNLSLSLAEGSVALEDVNKVQQKQMGEGQTRKSISIQ